MSTSPHRYINIHLNVHTHMHTQIISHITWGEENAWVVSQREEFQFYYNVICSEDDDQDSERQLILMLHSLLFSEMTSSEMTMDWYHSHQRNHEAAIAIRKYSYRKKTFLQCNVEVVHSLWHFEDQIDQ